MVSTLTSRNPSRLLTEAAFMARACRLSRQVVQRSHEFFN